MKGAYLGPSYEQKVIEEKLTECGAIFDVLSSEDMIEKTALALSNEKAVGWFQGRMEFGPRSLGARSILGDPRSDSMQKTFQLQCYKMVFLPVIFG